MADYTRDQLFDALRKADAAGDTEAAQALTAKIKEMSAGGEAAIQQAVQSGKSREEIKAIADAHYLSVNDADLDANLKARETGGVLGNVQPPEWENTLSNNLSYLADSAQNIGAGLAQGALGVAEFPFQVGQSVNNAINSGLRTGGGALLDFVGAENAADWWRGNGTPQNALLMPSEQIEQAMPTPEGMGGQRFGAQIVGGMLVPFGPKAAPKAKPVSPAAQNAAADVVQTGEREGVRVMTSDVRPPRSFVGKSARALGERIPFAGTAGPRIKQQEERINLVKNLARDFGVEGSQGVLEDVADDLAKTRGGKIAALTARKNKIIDDLSAPQSKPDQVPNVRNSAIPDTAPTTKSKPDQIPVPELRGHEGSWFVVDRETGKGVTEIFKPDAALAAKVNRDKYDLVPAGDYLGRVNALIKEAGGVQPTDDAFKAAFGAKAGAGTSAKTSANPTAALEPTPVASAPIVRTPKAVAEIDSQITNLKRIGNPKLDRVIKELEQFRGVLTSGKSLREIEENRKILGDMFADQDLASVKSVGQKAINAIYAPLRDDMGEFIKANGGNKAFNAWKQSNDQLAAMAGELDASTFKRVLSDTDTTPENVARLLFSKKPSDVRRLFGSLSPQGQEKAKAAVIYEAIRKSGGLDDISPQKFANSLKDFGRTTGIIFGDDAPRIEGIVRLLHATQQASVAAAAPPTGVQNTVPVMAAILTDWMGTAGGAMTSAGLAGAGARLYESRPIRNLLIGLGRTKAGSPQEAKMLGKIEKVMVSQTGLNASAANDDVGMALAAEEPSRSR